MKIVLDLKADREPKENDVIIYKKGWSVVSRESMLAPIIESQVKTKKDLTEANAALKQEIENLKKDFVKLAKIVKEK